MTDGSFAIKGDAARTVDAIIAAADTERPTLRLARGSTVQSISSAPADRLKAIRTQQDVALSPDQRWREAERPTLKGEPVMRTGLVGIVLLGAALGGLAIRNKEARSAERVPNKVAGTWRMVSARIDPDGRNKPAYGPKPSGMLVFTEDMHFVEVLTDSTVPKFASNVRGDGTDEENRRAMAGSIGFFGSYTVDGSGEFSGNRVDGSTFPNWIGDVRTRKELRLTVDGDRMTEAFQRPDGTRIAIVFERAR